jgi:nucleotide-binding universal stress UspA family protein
MKILIGCDGTPAGRAALEDLARAGLPPDADAVAMTVADVWLAPGDPDPRVSRAIPAVGRAHERAERLLADARAEARRSADRLRRLFPGWTVAEDAAADSPAWALLKKARAWSPDLLVVGATGKKALARLTLGSVSQKVLAEARGSVRIGRSGPPTDGGLRLLVAVDGSPDSERAVNAVLQRRWPADTRVRVIAVVDDRLLSAAALRMAPLARWMKPGDTDPAAWVGRMVEESCARLQGQGLLVSGRVEKGNPKTVLVEKAAKWRAHALYLGARGLTRWERFMLGSVSTAVAARAACSVEVVRGPRRETALTGPA